MQSPLSFTPSQKPARPIFGVDRFSTGLWTQRNVLRDASTPYIYERYAGSKFDSLIDGSNVEITTKLTLARRPGTSVYNSQTFAAINRFYDFHTFSTNSETIRVMADTSANVYDATGPNTKTLILTKSSGAGSTYFQSVGNTLYFGNGVDEKKWVQSELSWSAAHTFTSGDYIVDTNNNIQVATGARSANIINFTIASNVVTVTTSSKVSQTFNVGMNVALSGFTTATYLNSQTVTLTAVSYNQLVFAFTHGNVSLTSDAGLASIAGGTTGGSQPSWATTIGSITTDNNEQWLCHGTSVQTWGTAAPTTAPTVSLATLPNAFPSWAASTVYSPSLSVLKSGFIQKVTTAGTTGASEPSFNATPGGTTSDGSVVWTNQGSATWAASTAYALNYILAVTFTYWVTVPGDPDNSDVDLSRPRTIAPNVSYSVTVSAFFKATTTGTTGGTQPNWIDGVGSTVLDGTVTWTNIGAQQTWATNVGALTLVSVSPAILDSNGNKQYVTVPGKSGLVAPTWSAVTGATTIDNAATWTNQGPFSTTGTGSWTYAYAFKNSVDDTVSTASPLSSNITVASGYLINVQGAIPSDTQIDTIQIYRTLQDGSTLFFLDEIPAPTTGVWNYADILSDSQLNELIEAEINNANDAPPDGLIKLTYHLNRVWGCVGNTVYYSNGPDTTNGNGSQAFPPNNNFVFPSQVTRLVPNALGLLIFTVSDVYLIAGQATTSFPLFSSPFVAGVGLSNYDALDVNGSIVYMLTSDGQVIAFDPNSGISEIGFPIGNLLSALNPTTAHVTWHVSGSNDKALYVSDFASGWYRMNPTSAPESGLNWSPFATIHNGLSAVQSLQVSPGVHRLLIGSITFGGAAIQQRDTSVYSDNGTTYTGYATFGSHVLALPGQMAALEFVTIDSAATGTPLVPTVLLDEISSGFGGFASLSSSVADPPQLSSSSSINGLRYYFSATLAPAWCRHMQIKMTLASENNATELFSYTLYGALWNE